MTQDLSFESLRSDWYAGNTVLPRRFVKAILGVQPLRLVGFPAQWIPACVHFGVQCVLPLTPKSYLPLFSDLSSEAVAELAQTAKRQGSSRQLLEATAALDPVLADFLYIVDHKLAAAGYRQAEAEAINPNPLNTWHSFGRPEIVTLQERMCRWVASNDTFLMLPCSRRRPYGESRTHKRLAADLAAVGQAKANATRVVVTALGVVPEPFWNEPLVMGYDAGAVDLWRVFQLLRQFFAANPGRVVVDCLSFKPYSQMLATLYSLNHIDSLLRPLKIRWRSFCVDLK